MGRTGGGVFNMTGKSGRERLAREPAGTEPSEQGAVALYFARKACDDGSGSCEKPDTYFYLYAGSLGGPIVKNKTFFWASFEGYQRPTRSTTPR